MKTQAAIFTLFICFSSTARGQEAFSLADVDSSRNQAGGISSLYDPEGGPSVSDDGQLIVFSSKSSGLVAGDANGFYDIFLRDRQAGTTIRVSLSTSSGDPDGSSKYPSISGNGQFIVFASDATNLVTGDTNGVRDCFVYNIGNGTTQRVSVVGAGGSQLTQLSTQPSISANGQYIAFATGSSNVSLGGSAYVVAVRDTTNNTTTALSQKSGGGLPNGSSTAPWISADGAYVAFESDASDLLAASADTNGMTDVFRVNRSNGAIVRVSVTNAGAETSTGDSGLSDFFAFPNLHNVISANGSRVIFGSNATDLASVDSRTLCDLFMRDIGGSSTVRIGNPSGGGDPNGPTTGGALSASGRYVILQSEATNVIAADTNGEQDVFSIDTLLGQTHRVTEVHGGAEADGGSGFPATSPDGRHVVFLSAADNLAASDTMDFDFLVLDECYVDVSSSGSGTAGTGSIVPVLSGPKGLCEAGGSRIDISSVLGGATGVLIIGAAAGSSSFYGGTLLIDLNQPYLISDPFQVGGSGAGNGTFSIPGPDLHGYEGTTSYWQFLATDAGAGGGVSFTNGVQYSIKP